MASAGLILAVLTNVVADVSGGTGKLLFLQADLRGMTASTCELQDHFALSGFRSRRNWVQAALVRHRACMWALRCLGSAASCLSQGIQGFPYRHQGRCSHQVRGSRACSAVSMVKQVGESLVFDSQALQNQSLQLRHEAGSTGHG